MITGELKNRIDGLWDVFAAGGLVNPLDVIEQITYLMFIHDLDDADNLRAKEAVMLGLPHKSIFAGNVEIGGREIEGNQLKWSVFRYFPAAKMYTIVQEWVFPFIKNLHNRKDSAYSKYMGDAIFKIPTPLLLDKVVIILDDIYDKMAGLKDTDIRGDVYEYMLSKISQSGLAGAFRTPRHIIRMMVELVEPKADDIICDPACGTSGFLVGAGDYLRENKKEEIFFNREKKDHYMNHMFHGYDMDRTMLRIGAMNMMIHGVDDPFIEYRDSLSDQNPDSNKYSLILANPPFKGSLDSDIVSADLLKVCKTKKTELLFIALMIRMLRVGGRCACIVPDGVLFGSSTAHKAIRKALIDENKLEAVISMPSGVFKPYAGVSTGILVFTKTGHGGTDNVWFYDMKADGFTLDDKRTPTEENDIPDIIARFHNRDVEKDRKRTEQSFFVPKDEIVNNDYDLSINKYKKTEYKPVEYPPTSEILADLKTLNTNITEDFSKLEKMLIDKKDEKKSEDKHQNIALRLDEMVYQGCSFMACAEICDEKEEEDRSLTFMMMSPKIINYAFSCEVFLKALGTFYGVSNGKTHKLNELFDTLPDHVKESIQQNTYMLCGEWYNPLYVIGEDGHRYSYLDQISDAFVEWRYSYEHHRCSLQCETGFLRAFTVALRENCCVDIFGMDWSTYSEKVLGRKMSK